MSPQEIDMRLSDLPFVPFRLYISNGETYDVTHPDMVLVGLASLRLGIPTQTDPDNPSERAITISLFHVVKIEPVATAPASQG